MWKCPLCGDVLESGHVAAHADEHLVILYDDDDVPYVCTCGHEEKNERELLCHIDTHDREELKKLLVLYQMGHV